MGAPATTDTQLVQLAREVEKLREELRKLREIVTKPPSNNGDT